MRLIGYLEGKEFTPMSKALFLRPSALSHGFGGAAMILLSFYTDLVDIFVPIVVR